MKKFLILAIAIISFVLVKADDYKITFNQLPSNAQTFITNHFDQSNITMILVDKERLSKEYKVYFKDGSKVKFNSDGEWSKVKVTAGGVPKECVPTEVTAYVWESYPQNMILEIDRHGKGYEVELSNGLDLKFNRHGEFIKID